VKATELGADFPEGADLDEAVTSMQTGRGWVGLGDPRDSETKRGGV
jgi:hypothetical protein